MSKVWKTMATYATFDSYLKICRDRFVGLVIEAKDVYHIDKES